MRRILPICLLAAFVITGCSNKNNESQVPVQDYASGYESQDSQTGDVIGSLRFPSEYNQRSLKFTINKRAFFTQPDGRFHLENIPVGQYRLIAVVKGYEPVKKTFTIAADQTVVLKSLPLAIARGRVVGRLVAESGQSASDVKVQLAPQGGLAMTDNDGIFQFVGVPTGDYKLQVSDKKFFTYDRKITMESGKIQNLGNIEVHPRVQLPIQRTARMADQ